MGSFDVTSQRGNNFILVVIDMLSRYILIIPVPNKSALTIGKQLVDIFNTMGYPKIINHDQGLEFNNKLISSIVKYSGIEQRLSLPYQPTGNAVCESAVKRAKKLIVKMLKGYEESWDLYCYGTAYVLNNIRSRLHHMKPFEVMYNRKANDLKDYSDIAPYFPEGEINIEELKAKMKLIDKIIVPAIKEQVAHTQRKDNAYFMKRRKILENPYPIGATCMIKNMDKTRKTDKTYIGPYQIHGYTKNGSYILIDATGTFLGRDVATSQIKLLEPKGTLPENTYEIGSIRKHEGTGRDDQKIKYLVRWRGYDESYDTWEPLSSFDSQECITEYWNRLDANKPDKQTKRARTVPTINKRKRSERIARNTRQRI